MTKLSPSPAAPTATATATRVRIASHVTQSRFLHVEDSLKIGKIRLYAGHYQKNEGASSLTAHFLDVPDARVLFDALARGEEGFAYKEYKGTPSPNGQSPVSRVLSVAVKGGHVYVELKSGPGKLTPTGAITPAGPAQVAINVSFKQYEARRLAAEALAYLQAWDVVRMMAQRQQVGQPIPYLTTAVGGEEGQPTARSRQAEAAGVAAPLINAAGAAEASKPWAHGRPVTRKDVVKTNGAAAKPAPGKPLASGPALTGPLPPPETAVSVDAVLQYGNGIQIDSANVIERQTFQRYVAENQAAPDSKAALLAYYRQQGSAAHTAQS